MKLFIRFFLISLIVFILIFQIPLGSSDTVINYSYNTSTSANIPRILYNNSTIPYVKIMIYNNQTVSTVDNFQMLVNVNWDEYKEYLNANCSNVRFYNTTSAIGNTSGYGVLPAWIETNNTNTSTSSNVWINMKGTIIPASGSINIYMAFLPKSISWNAYLGLNPTLSSTYGQFDNGAKVFLIYNNGTNLFPIKQKVTVNSGLSTTTSAPSPYMEAITGSVSGGTANSNTWTINGETSTTLPSSYIAQMMVEITGSSPLTDLLTNFQGVSGQFYVFRFDARSGYNDLIGNYSSGATATTILATSSIRSSTGTWYQMTAVDNNDVLSLYKSTSFNLNNFGSLEAGPVNGKKYTGGGIAVTTDGATSTDYWTMIIVRAYPPNGVMPSYSFSCLYSKSLWQTNLNNYKDQAYVNITDIWASSIYTQENDTTVFADSYGNIIISWNGGVSKSYIQSPYIIGYYNLTNVLAFVPITLTNSQSTPTPKDFQQLLQINWSAYSSYLNANVSNVRFFSSTDFLPSNELPGWIETNNSTTAASSKVWVNLSGTIIPSDGTATIYMAFLNKSASWNSTYWGLAPELSTTYGQFDNGAHVFSFYDNFAGTTLSSVWTVPSGSNYEVNNGFIAEPSGGATAAVYNANIEETSSVIVEWLLNMSSTTYSSYPNYFQLNRYTGYSNLHWLGESGIDQLENNNNEKKLVSIPSTGNQVFGVWNDGNTVTWYYPGGSYTNTSAKAETDYVALIWAYNGQSYNAPTMYWVRLRADPPNGVMPSVSFGYPGYPKSCEYLGSIVSIAAMNISYPKRAFIDMLTQNGAIFELNETYRPFTWVEVAKLPGTNWTSVTTNVRAQYYKINDEYFYYTNYNGTVYVRDIYNNSNPYIINSNTNAVDVYADVNFFTGVYSSDRALPASEEFTVWPSKVLVNYIGLGIYSKDGGTINISIGTGLWQANILANHTVQVSSGFNIYYIPISNIVLYRNNYYYLNVYTVSGTNDWLYAKSPYIYNESYNYAQDYYYAGNGKLKNNNLYPLLFSIAYQGSPHIISTVAYYNGYLYGLSWNGTVWNLTNQWPAGWQSYSYINNTNGGFRGITLQQGSSQSNSYLYVMKIYNNTPLNVSSNIGNIHMTFNATNSIISNYGTNEAITYDVQTTQFKFIQTNGTVGYSNLTTLGTYSISWSYNDQVIGQHYSYLPILQINSTYPMNFYAYAYLLKAINYTYLYNFSLYFTGSDGKLGLQLAYQYGSSLNNYAYPVLLNNLKNVLINVTMKANMAFNVSFYLYTVLYTSQDGIVLDYVLNIRIINHFSFIPLGG